MTTFFKWTNAAAAKADAVTLSDRLGNVGFSPDTNDWMSDHVLINLDVWRPSQDVLTGSPAVLTHTYLTGFFVLISVDRRLNFLLNAAALQFALDRGRFKAGQSFVIKNNIGAVITDIAVSPLFAGCDYPIGGFPAPDSPP